MTRILALIVAASSLALASCECCKSKKESSSCCADGKVSACCAPGSKSDCKDCDMSGKTGAHKH